MSRRKYRGKKQNPLSMLMVFFVLLVMTVAVGVRCHGLKEKQEGLELRKAELQQQIEMEQARTQELEELRKYVQTDSYAEKIAEEKLGLVHGGEIIFRMEK